jgi:hypothetical protein
MSYIKYTILKFELTPENRSDYGLSLLAKFTCCADVHLTAYHSAEAPDCFILFPLNCGKIYPA